MIVASRSPWTNGDPWIGDEVMCGTATHDVAARMPAWATLLDDLDDVAS